MCALSKYAHLYAVASGRLLAKWSIMSVYICVPHSLHFSMSECVKYRCSPSPRDSVNSRIHGGTGVLLSLYCVFFGEGGGVVLDGLFLGWVVRSFC